MEGFVRREGVLHGDGVALPKLAERFGTPLYVYSRSSLTGALAAWNAAYDWAPHRVCYAVKANASGAILRLFASLGAGADIVSGGEMLAALRAGFPPEAIVFAGVGKTDAELTLGLEKGVGDFNVESEEEVHRLSRLATSLGRTARISLRVNPDIDARSHPYISTGLRQSKFGVDIGDAAALVRRLVSLPSVEVRGLHFHIGSQITEIEPIEAAARELVELARTLLAEGIPLRFIDLGGGLGIDYEGCGVPSPSDLGQRLRPILENLPLEIVLEPGRSLVAASGVLLTRVVLIKEHGGKRFVVVDAGMNDLIRPALYEAYHRIEPVEERVVPMATVDVVGPICETGDFLALDREMPEVEVGDLLAVRDAGAYCFSMASNYNMRPRPAEVVVSNGEPTLARRRESFDDLVRNEV